MGYISEDKKTNTQESYIPDWLDDIQENQFNPDMIPWVNEPQLNWGTSIES